MNYFLYILKSSHQGRYYIGTASDIDKRLIQHNQGRVRSTKAYRPWSIVYTKIFTDKTLARKAEINLKKNYQVRKELFGQIENE